MADDTLFVASTGELSTLGSVAESVFKTLGVPETEERFSSNYPPDEHYFVGYAANLVIKIFELADVKDGYPYCISTSTPTRRKGGTPVLDTSTAIAKALAKAGLRVFVPTERWAHLEWDGEGTTYAP